MSEPGHDVPDVMRRGGKVVVGEVEAAKASHVSQGRGRHEGQFVGGHVQGSQGGQVEGWGEQHH